MRKREEKGRAFCGGGRWGLDRAVCRRRRGGKPRLGLGVDRGPAAHEAKEGDRSREKIPPREERPQNGGPRSAGGFSLFLGEGVRPTGDCCQGKKTRDSVQSYEC